MKVNQREALATLTKVRLRELVMAFDLDAPATLRKDEVIDLLARSRRASFENLLGHLKRDELKGICVDAGLDDSGRANAAIIDRILGRVSASEQLTIDGAPAPEPQGKRRRKGGKASKKGAQNRGKDSGGATLDFKTQLWQAADKLRNNMDAAEYKHVVLGLIFLKYISDAFEEKHAELLREVDRGADPEHPDEYSADRIFWVPAVRRVGVAGRGTNVNSAPRRPHEKPAGFLH